jgi:hypothetical protein
LVPGNDRPLMRREVAFDGVQIGVAEAADGDFHTHFAWAGLRDGEVRLAKGVVVDGACVLKNHCAHGNILGDSPGSALIGPPY